MMAEFIEKFPGGANGKGRRNSFDFSQYLQERSSASGFQQWVEGRMMTQAMYFDWAETPQGGSMTQQDMIKAWDRMLNTKGWKRDHKARNGEVRLAVVESDKFKVYNRTEQTHRIIQGNRQGKPLSVEQEQMDITN
jgi:hypothetical protein